MLWKVGKRALEIGEYGKQEIQKLSIPNEVGSFPERPFHS
jgi:hypothetical protein